MTCRVCDICHKKIKSEPVKLTVNYSENYKPIDRYLCIKCWQEIFEFIDDMEDGVIRD